MLSKLLKYDFRRVKRVGLPILIATLLATVVGSLNSLFFGHVTNALMHDDSVALILMMILSVLFMMLIIVVFALAVAGVQIAVFVDFYKSLITDEGYLAFTLPVKPKTIIFSKVINSCLWNLIVGAVATVGMALVMGIMSLSEAGSSDITGSLVGSEDGVGLFFVLLIALVIVYFLNSQLLYFLAIFFGSVIAKKNKLVAAVGCVIGVNMFYGTALSLVIMVPFIMMVSAGSTASNPFVAINVGLFIIIAILGALTFLFYYLLKYMMEKKLNLP